MIDRLERKVTYSGRCFGIIILYAKLQVGVLRRMQLYGFSLRDSYVAPISEIKSILFINVAVIHSHQE
jgi:hypothetical protein